MKYLFIVLILAGCAAPGIPVDCPDPVIPDEQLITEDLNMHAVDFPSETGISMRPYIALIDGRDSFRELWYINGQPASYNEAIDYANEHNDFVIHTPTGQAEWCGIKLNNKCL